MERLFIALLLISENPSSFEDEQEQDWEAGYGTRALAITSDPSASVAR